MNHPGWELWRTASGEFRAWRLGARGLKNGQRLLMASSAAELDKKIAAWEDKHLPEKT